MTEAATRLSDDEHSKIRILVPIRYPVGGIRTYLKYTYGQLAKHKYEFDLVAPEKKWLEQIADDLKGFRVMIFPTGKENSSKALLTSVFSMLGKNNYQIIHSQGYTAGIMAIMANIIYGVPHVITLHHIFGHGQFSDKFWGRFRWLKQLSIQYALSRANIIQAVSDDAMNNLLEYFPGLQKWPDKLVTIRNGIDVEDFLRDGGKAEQPFRKEPAVFYLGFFGRYMPEKGFPFLIDTMEILVKERGVTDIRALSVGGFGGFVREYKKFIDDKDLGEYFIFIDFMDNVVPALKQVDALVIPSLGEACGLIAMEGLICGTPTVGFSCIGLREVMRNTPALLVPVGNAQKLASEVLHLKNSYKDYKKIFEDFRPQACKRFDVSLTAKMLDRIFRQMTSI